MDISEYLRGIDAQIEQAKLREQGIKRKDRRKNQIPVAVERRSGQDRRKIIFDRL